MFKIIALIVAVNGSFADVMTSKADYPTREACEAARPDSVAKLQADLASRGVVVGDSKCVSKEEIEKARAQEANK